MLQQDIEHSERVIATLINQIQTDGAPAHGSNAPKRDYVRENYLRIQQLQTNALNKEKVEKSKEPSLKKFGHVQAKVYDSQNKQIVQPRPASVHPRTHTSLSNKENARCQSVDTKRSAASHQSNETMLVPKLDLDTPSTSNKLTNVNGSTVQSRKQSALSIQRKRQPSAIHTLGSIPKYLQEMKETASRAKDTVKEEEEVTPEGNRQLPETERIAMLEKLRKHEAELLGSLSALPLRLDTHYLQQKKRNIEEQLTKVEEGIKIFSRARVFVKNE